MDNEEYKEPCENKYEKELLTKINSKLQKMTEEKIAKLEKERYKQQQAKEEQYRLQLLAIEKQKLAAQQAQAKAAEDGAFSAERAARAQKRQADQQFIDSVTPKRYNVTPNYMGGYNIRQY